MAVRVAVLADTHLHTRPDGRGRDLPPAAWQQVAAADVILHAGDVLDAGLLERLAVYAPVFAVLGNNDVDLVGVLPLTRTVELEGVEVAMIHDSGTTRGRAARMAKRFPSARVVVFGHSHAPLDEEGERGQRLFNPGSPTQRRAQPVPTMGELHLSDGRLMGHRIIPLPQPS